MQGWRMKAGILIGYFAKRSEVREVLKKLQKSGFHRVALVSKSADGETRTWHPFVWRRAFGATLAFVLFGVLAGVTFTGCCASMGPSDTRTYSA